MQWHCSFSHSFYIFSELVKQKLNWKITFFPFRNHKRITPLPRSIARTAIRRTVIGSTVNNAANNNNIGVIGPVTLQTQIGSLSQNGKCQLQILAQPEQQHRARWVRLIPKSIKDHISYLINSITRSDIRLKEVAARSKTAVAMDFQ